MKLNEIQPYQDLRIGSNIRSASISGAHYQQDMPHRKV